MLIINQNTKRSYLCSRADGAKILGVCPKTLYNWEKAGNGAKSVMKAETEFKVIFRDPKVIKQKKGTNRF